MARRPLRHGYTTGACAAAAALAAARMLRERRPVAKVELTLPAGIRATFAVAGARIGADRAACHVVKDAGDDPDVTHGAEIHAEVILLHGEDPGNGGVSPLPVLIEAGEGIGRITKPGLAVPVGEPAVNPVPRRMIEEAVRSVFPEPRQGLRVVLSIPDGLERSGRTLNARLGIEGGLSILGTTGVVTPVSHQAWTDTIDVALDVARAAGCGEAVLATGRTSELAAQRRLSRREECFVLVGDHIGHALGACRQRGFGRVILAIQFAKLYKVACGHPQTHAGRTRLDLGELLAWPEAAALDPAVKNRIKCANTARELFEVPEIQKVLLPLVSARALARLAAWAPGTEPALLVVDYHGRPAAWFERPSAGAAGKGRR